MFEPDLDNVTQQRDSKSSLRVTRSTRLGSGRKLKRDSKLSLRCISCEKVFKSKVSFERHVDQCLDAIEATNERKLNKLR